MLHLGAAIGASRRAVLALGALGALFSRARAADPRQRYPGEIVISAEDIAWFRSCRSLWVDGENGAPAIFGSGLTPETIGTISAEDYTAYEIRMEPILCAFFLHASFEPGTYRFAQELDGRTDIAVTAEDITLLRTTSWKTFAIDNKRPYGDFVNYPIEMAQALGIPVTKNAKGYAEIAPDAEARMVELHRKSQFVLQAYIEHARLEPGAWFIPQDGWGMIVFPRCRPVKPAAIAAYKATMATIALRAQVESAVDLVVPRIQASVALFSSE